MQGIPGGGCFGTRRIFHIAVPVDKPARGYHWFHYPEVGGWPEEIKPHVRSPNLYAVPFKAPADTDSEPHDAHIIHKVTDKGSPALTRYRRVIVTIQP